MSELSRPSYEDPWGLRELSPRLQRLAEQVGQVSAAFIDQDRTFQPGSGQPVHVSQTGRHEKENGDPETE